MAGLSLAKPTFLPDVDNNDDVTPQQLEFLVLAAIDRLRAGGQIEDDRIEAKRDWPDPAKARQLGGSANRARGELLIYVVGVDDKTGATHPTGGQDVAAWWAQMSARFDQTPPEMIHHLNVAVGPGESVAAILFATDRAPYVVKTSGGTPEREVPMREGTRTRSATRVELLRMLAPEIGTPPAVLLSAEGGGEWHAERAASPAGGGGSAAHTTLTFSAEVFIEHVGPHGILLPAHEMVAELVSDSVRLHLDVRARARANDAPPPPAFGLDARREGIAATGPGKAWLQLGWSGAGDHRERLVPVQAWDLHLRLGVTGSSRPIRLDAHMTRLPDQRRRISPDEESLPRWGFRENPPVVTDW